ncbi:MAG TPA: DoxX family protein [Candidatus Didemnitutus sp.]|nr:DoxX family protein [Candidatus Didemnitutus sp.]
MQLSSLLNSLVATGDSFAPLFLRLALGLMILPHGLQKTIGAFGGYGFKGTMGYLTGTVGAPWALAALAILAESLGGVLLIAGFGTRVAALLLGGVMVVAAAQHRANGFFMNWSGQQKGEGIEFHLLALGMVIALLFLGGGKWSVDSLFVR